MLRSGRFPFLLKRPEAQSRACRQSAVCDGFSCSRFPPNHHHRSRPRGFHLTVAGVSHISCCPGANSIETSRMKPGLQPAPKDDRIAPILTLAPELLELIAVELTHAVLTPSWSCLNPALHSLSLVCKSLSKIFRPFIFRTITIRSFEIPERANGEPGKLKKLTNVLSSSASRCGGANLGVGAFVQELSITMDERATLLWDEDLLTVSHLLPNLHTLHIGYQKAFAPMIRSGSWYALSAAFKETLTNFLTNPSLVSLDLGYMMMFDIPHRLLLQAPSLERLTIQASDGRDVHTRRYRVEYWQKLDTTYRERNATLSYPWMQGKEEERMGGEERKKRPCRSFTFRGPDLSGWLDFLETIDPGYFTDITSLEVETSTRIMQSILDTALEIQRLSLNWSYTGMYNGLLVRV